ncbi:acetoin dehydrogenase [Actinoplanes sp. NBRC 14428]|uniref:Short-subunit dehydrogenase n=1 Tax=Pseudosporangium ferrugineum TaxID=439699 RepID=A0A2T0S8B9_9ACTN|nr:SDR family NAD(P)-dependent oxidoreductase [Pseudosporangium ferrugineum]PRY29645.1 short-subunit dehydrogenase [Pseudosporangium ferrugineum]BCJ52600.1 acetoin dehydrogenase [Actinoplanes sp. NBRC 14428]
MATMERFAFAGRTCVITGAASGIGAALTLELAKRRAVLALVDRDADGLARVSALAREVGAGDVSTWVVDLSDGGDRLDLAAEVAARHGGADLLINNAGVVLSGTFEQVSMKDFDWLMEINLHAVVRLTKAFLPQLLARPGSHVVNISSLFGLVAPPTQVAYVTSKYAVRGFSEALRHELAGRRVGLTVVHPGGVRTNIARNARMSLPDDDGAQAAQHERFTERALTLPPEEAARQIVAAVQARRPRLVITRAAKLADLLARVAPGRYWSVIERGLRGKNL